jgi:putative ABC transport system ATP-binding protein
MNELVTIDVSNVCKNIQLANKKETLKILKNISLKAYQGEFLSIIGPSGSGKSTLLNAISGLEKPSEGIINVLNVDPYKLRVNTLAKFRREQIGFIFQSYNLIPALTAYENVVLPLRLSHKKIDRNKVSKLLKDINFDADLNSNINSLSGGERQKIAIARVLLADSKIVFADEPTGAVDSISKQKIFNLLKLLTTQGKTVVMVTHDIEMAAKTDRSLILKDGMIFDSIESPTAESLFKAMKEMAV